MNRCSAADRFVLQQQPRERLDDRPMFVVGEQVFDLCQESALQFFGAGLVAGARQRQPPNAAEVLIGTAPIVPVGQTSLGGNAREENQNFVFKPVLRRLCSPLFYLAGTQSGFVGNDTDLVNRAPDHHCNQRMAGFVVRGKFATLKVGESRGFRLVTFHGSYQIV